MADGEEIELKSHQAAIVRDSHRRHFRAILPTKIMFDLKGIGERIIVRVKPIDVFDVGPARERGEDVNKYFVDNYIIINVNRAAVKNLTNAAETQRASFENAYQKRGYELGITDCFQFALDILNNRINGDLKHEPEGDDNDDKFEDLIRYKEGKEQIIKGKKRR